ncbi:hypothetical protein ABZV31_03110 [Streptomyces sp. NPDC005202]|uniref:hypothetical protein n=1 Tax=Streptomyces sp. NPDC005202 TaxID=3157021 RepID=UPI0033B40A86
MAKNKKQDRSQQKTSGAEHGPQETQRPMEPPSEHHVPPVNPGDIARKGRQKRFGHN